MFNRAIFDHLFLKVCCLDKYITQKMCDKDVDDSIATLGLIPDQFIASKMIIKLSTASCADENILYFNEDSGNIVSNCIEMSILNIDFVALILIIILIKVILILLFLSDF